ncbi:hypothetical protein DPEC_G00089580 [Dallia pectoralis]|uniref:Uncharacterized protein n=1 Tax=Dallia pectoralis TaxID=75939 RepID=A0ACC2H1G1_DALPE|nr:hypothetical protein DPEC_G00089580 [Dallia pectoralis]
MSAFHLTSWTKQSVYLQPPPPLPLQSEMHTIDKRLIVFLERRFHRLPSLTCGKWGSMNHLNCLIFDFRDDKRPFELGSPSEVLLAYLHWERRGVFQIPLL